SRRSPARCAGGARAHRQLRVGRRRLPVALHHGLDVPVPGSPNHSRPFRVVTTEETTMHRRTWLILLTVAILAVPVAAHAQKPIKVGMPIPLSGPPALFGDPASKGAMMFVEEINAKGGVLGRKIELIVRDSKADANEAVRQARELILKDNVDFLVGTLTSAEGPAVSVVAKENKIVFIAPIPKTDQLTAADKLHPYVFRVAANTTMEGRSAAEIVAKWPVTKIATIAFDYAYGQD